MSPTSMAAIASDTICLSDHALFGLLTLIESAAKDCKRPNTGKMWICLANNPQIRFWALRSLKFSRLKSTLVPLVCHDEMAQLLRWPE